MSAQPCLSGPAAAALQSSDARIVITGASGWIGKATLELLYNTLGRGDFTKRVFAFGSAPRTIDFGAGTIAQRPLIALLALPPAPTFVLHLAFLTKDKVTGIEEEEYCRLNRALSRMVLEALDMIGVTAVFVASSGAAQFANDPDASPAMRLYGSLKSADEEAFARWAEERRRRAVVARIFALSGPHINKHDTYALASFIRDALAGGPISVRSDRPVYRSYVSIRELMSLIFSLMLEEEAGVVRFSTGGERLELQRIAEIVSQTVGPVAIERPPLKAGPADEYVGDDAAYREQLSAYGLDHLPFAQQVAETATSFASDAASEEGSRYA